MGAQVVCRATLDGEASRGTALLETAEVIFRGDFRARVPFASLKSVGVKGDMLTLKWPGGVLALELDDAVARKWLEKIKNPPNRLDKLGVKPGERVAPVGSFAFDDAFAAEIAKRGAAITARGSVDVLFFAPSSPIELARVAKLTNRLTPAGGLWIGPSGGGLFPGPSSAHRALVDTWASVMDRARESSARRSTLFGRKRMPTWRRARVAAHGDGVCRERRYAAARVARRLDASAASERVPRASPPTTQRERSERLPRASHTRARCERSERAPSPPAVQTSSRMRSGSSTHSLTRTRNCTASRPSMRRWS
jgi:hypothetical protein